MLPTQYVSARAASGASRFSVVSTVVPSGTIETACRSAAVRASKLNMTFGWKNWLNANCGTIAT